MKKDRKLDFTVDSKVVSVGLKIPKKIFSTFLAKVKSKKFIHLESWSDNWSPITYDKNKHRAAKKRKEWENYGIMTLRVRGKDERNLFLFISKFCLNQEEIKLNNLALF